MRSSRENAADGDVIADDVKIALKLRPIEARKVSWFVNGGSVLMVMIIQELLVLHESVLINAQISLCFVFWYVGSTTILRIDGCEFLLLD